MAKRKKSFLTPWRVVIGAIIITALVCVGVWFLMKDASIPVLNPQGVIANQEKQLMMFTLMLSLVVVVPVFLMIGIFAWKYREGNHKSPYTPDADGNTWLETLWWGIPILIIGVLGVVTVVSTHQLDPHKPLSSDVKPLTVQVVALQWKWLFIYPDQNVASLNELHIPTGTPVNFTLTADGPMSALWIPSLGSQVYAMTGMSAKLSLQADKPGTYRGSNSNINGTGYADMTFNTIAMQDRQAFDKWAKETALSADEQERHLDVDRYEELAKPSRKDPVTYYHLHDIKLYSKIVDKYMNGQAMADDHDHNHGEDE